MINNIFGEHISLHPHSVPKEVHLGFAHNAQMGIVTPLSDGFNLYSGEFIAAQNKDNPGVLILSKSAGAAEVLSGAMIEVDPLRPVQIAHAIERARNMSLEQRQEMHGRGMEIIGKRSSSDWQISIVHATLESAKPRI